MLPSIIICAVTSTVMILSILFFPKIRIGKAEVDSYWVVTLAGAMIILLTGTADAGTVLSAVVADTAINPLKILVLFISMTVLSIFLDEVGFFSYMAAVTLKKAGHDQHALFLYLYVIVSVLTTFTSNDVVILTFTPFIIYFAKHAGISPLPYLVLEFIAANTWSMAFIIGNPTNVYLSTAAGIGFMDYFLNMILPTAVAGIVSFLLLFLIFRKQLSGRIGEPEAEGKIRDRLLLAVGLVHLGLCTVLLAVSSYVHIEMYLVSLGFAVSLTVTVLAVSLVRKRKPVELIASAKRAPWQLIPFVLSMFVLILALVGNGVTERISAFFAKGPEVYTFGVTSFLAANVINNIPMSVLYSSVIEPLSGSDAARAVYASVVGSNLGAFLTPIGALAGIMWTSILQHRGVKFGFREFVRYGVMISIPTVLSTLAALDFVLR